MGITADSLTRKDHEFERDDLTRGVTGGTTQDFERCLCRTGSRTRKSPAGAMRQLERNVLLNVIDPSKWREHLYEMDYLRRVSGCARWRSAIRWSVPA